MATEVAAPRESVVKRAFTFVRDARMELDKVTWPDKAQVRQLSLFVVLFTILVGFVIAIIDLVMQGVLVRLIPSLLGRG